MTSRVESDRKAPSWVLNAMLIHAAQKGSARECKRLVRLGAELTAYDGEQRGPLHRAAEEGHIELCRTLIQMGAKVDEQHSPGLTPLRVAAFRNRADVCRLLIAEGASLTVKTWGGNTLLHGAVAGGPDACAVLIESGVDIHAKNDGGINALHIAAAHNDVGVCRVLVRAGLKHDEPGAGIRTNALTPFQYALDLGQLDVVRFFVLECGADLDQLTADGRPLEELAEGASSILEFLQSLRVEAAIARELHDAGNANRPSRDRDSLAL